MCGGTWAFSLYKLAWPTAPTANDEFLDCYRDTRDNRVMADKVTRWDMTPAVCRQHCLDKDARYYATQVITDDGMRAVVLRARSRRRSTPSAIFCRWRGNCFFLAISSTVSARFYRCCRAVLSPA